MKKQYILLLLAVLFFTGTTYAQLVTGGNMFLQGRWLEIGMCPNGAFGGTNIPAGYHPHLGFGGGNLAEVYDYGHDGWAVGAPIYMGDYTYPGSPFEGWEIQVNGQRAQAYYNFSGTYSFSGGGTMTGGGPVSYSNSGGVILGNWAGTTNGGNLDMKMETRVDTLASWVVCTVKMYNKTAAAIPGVYYWRSCDPDNDQTWPGGSFTTDNVVNYQNDAQHRVAITATGRSTTKPPLTLCTKDCRAVVLSYGSWGLTVGQDLAAVWAKTYAPGSGGYTVNVNRPGDIGIGIVFNVGTICPNDSAVVSYAYVFNGVSGVDSAFPDPLLSINKSLTITSHDTFDACLYPGLDSIPLDAIFADDKSWTWSKWSWSPGTGLSATTGTHIWARLNSIPGIVTYTVTGVDSFGPGCNNNPCLNKQFIFTIKSCHTAWNNSPCYGDSLIFRMTGDSLGASYKWYGPKKWTGKFTSSLHNPFIYPATYADSGVYYVVKTILGVNDTDSTYVTIHEKPNITATNNSPMCAGSIDTLLLSVLPASPPGVTFAWTGPAPNNFSSTLQFPTIPGFTSVDAGTYTVVATSPFGCKDTATTYSYLIPKPLPPTIMGPILYCQHQPFVPFTTSPTTGILWYTTAVGGVPSITPPTVDTGKAGYTTVYASVKTGSCESDRTAYTVRVVTTPKAPVTAYRAAYCQYVDPFEPIKVTHITTTDAEVWYSLATGGSPLPGAPTVDITKSGTYNYWVSLTDSGCEGPRSPVTIVVNPKPSAPKVQDVTYCQYWPSVAITATPGTTGGKLRWYISSVDSIGNVTAPVPSTGVPGAFVYYVDETTTFGCVSDRAPLTVTVNPKPGAPLTRDTMYCQWTLGATLTADSLSGSRLKWYAGGTLLQHAPTPYNTIPGDSVFHVVQVVKTCPSDSSKITVTTIYKPKFEIVPSSPFVCQFDSIRLAYKGPSIFDPAYIWSLPTGASYARANHEGLKSLPTDSMIYVRFDSAIQNNVIHLHVTNNDGFCFGDTTLRMKIVPQPLARSNTKADVCQGDTVTLALGAKSASASEFQWSIDGIPMSQSSALQILAHNNNSGGPFSISWSDSGHHVIQVSTSTEEGCKSLPTDDTVNVHVAPEATFTYATKGNGPLCLEDSVMFTATSGDYNNYYEWTPTHYFANINKPLIWGKLEESRSIVTLRVTDPFGCAATTSQEIDPSSCCTVGFPNAFTPNGDNKNDYFRPIYVGYHRFHMFRVANRWGQTVFESANSNMKWDGNYNGVPQDMGVYFYYIQYDCGGKTIEKTGNVTLIR